MPTKLTPVQKIMAARSVIREATPYYVNALLRVRFVEVSADECKATGFSTLGMTDGAVCYYCGAFVDTLSPAQMAAVLVHELLHFLRQDGARFKVFESSDPTGGNRRLANVACDIANNDDVIEGGWKLPGRPLTKAELDQEAHVEGIYWMPESLGMAHGRTAAEYLAELRKVQQQHQKKGKGKGKGQGGQGTPGQGDASSAGEGGVLGGQCGSAAGHAHPVEEKLLGKGKGSGKDQQKAGQAQAEGLSASEAERVRAQVAREVAAHIQAKGRGSVPGGLARWAEEHLKPPRIPWQQKLQRAARRAVQRRAGAQDYCWNKVSRRQGGLGFGLGAPRLPSLTGVVPSVAVVVDTSGSMSQEQLRECMSEAAGVLAAVGAAVQFCAIDSATEGVSRVRTVQEACAKLKGGGGTDMRPALKLLEESRTPPDVVIVMTDGMIGNPGPKPKAHVIWLLVGSDYVKDVKGWGEVIVARNEAA